MAATKTLTRASSSKKQAEPEPNKESQAESAIGVKLPPMDVRQMSIQIVGDSPLICHSWATKQKRTMLDKQMMKPQDEKEAKDPEQEYLDTLYPLPGESGYGFPAAAFKLAGVSACRFLPLKMTLVRGAFHVKSTHNGGLIKLFGTPKLREDMVRLPNGNADIRFRAEFPEWYVTLGVRYNNAAMSAPQIVHVLNVGGFGVGVGDWRPEKDGSNGLFHVATGAEQRDLKP